MLEKFLYREFNVDIGLLRFVISYVIEKMNYEKNEFTGKWSFLILYNRDKV